MGHTFVLPGQLRGFTNHLIGAIQRSAVRQLKVHHEITLVLLGNKTDGYSFKAKNRESHQSPVYEEGKHADPNQPSDNSTIAIDRDVKRPVESSEKESQEAIDQTRNEPPDNKADGENRSPKRPQRRLIDMSRRFFGAMPARLDAEHVTDRCNEERISRQ